MEKRWYSVWDPNIPKFFEPEKTLPEYFADHALHSPNRIALSFYGYDMTYRELDEAINRFAAGLVTLGVKRGDRVALYMHNCPQFVICTFGIFRAGGIVVPLNAMFKHAELEYELNDCGAETIVALDSLYPELRKVEKRSALKNVIVTSLRDYMTENPNLPLPREVEQPKVTFSEAIDFLDLLDRSLPQPAAQIANLRDIAILQYTGGTTGLPKGAMGTHYTLAHNVVGGRFWYGYEKNEVFIDVVPNYHVLGMIQCMCMSLSTGGRLVILIRFSPETLAKAIEQYKATVWITNTTTIIAMLEWPEISKYDLSSLRIIWYGGQPMPEEILARFKRMVPKAILGEGYGLSETFSQGGALTPRHRPKPGTIGIPSTGQDIKIVDLEKGTKELEPGEEGEIIIKGPGIMKGYWNNTKATEETLRDGWLYTGDIGRMDEEGYLTMVGRKKELIKCSGFSVFPTEVEELLYRHPAVMEVSVIGVQDPYRGETPKAFIVLKSEYKGKIREEDIIEWAKERMATYKRPRLIEFREDLPKNSFGKILRRVLMEEEERKHG